MKKAKKTKAKKSTGPKRSVSQAAANLRAAKSKTNKSAKTDAKVDAEPKGGVRPGSKLEIVVGLLTREGGCTGAEILTATGWPTVSVPQQAKAAGLTLSKVKDGKVTRYSAVATPAVAAE